MSVCGGEEGIVRCTWLLFGILIVSLSGDFFERRWKSMVGWVGGYACVVLLLVLEVVLVEGYVCVV